VNLPFILLEIILFKRLLDIFRNFRIGIFISIVIGCLTIISSIALMGVSAYLIISAGFHPSIALLQVSIVGVRLFGTSRSVFRYLERIQTHKTNFKIIGKLRLNLFSRIYDNYFDLLNSNSGSKFLTILINDLNNFENLFVRLFSPTIVALVISFLVGLYLGLQSREILVLYTVGFFFGNYLIFILSIKMSKKNKGNLEKRKNEYQFALINFFQFIEEAIFYQNEAKLIEEVNQSSINLEKEQIKSGIWQSFWQLISFFSTQMVFLVALFLCIYLANQGKLELVMVGVLSLVIISSFEVSTNLPSIAYLYSDYELSIKRVADLMDLETKTASDLSKSELDLYPVRFENVSFRYPEINEKIIIKNINFEVHRGEKIAIIGENGTGKTTLIELLLGFRKNYIGRIMLKDQELRDIPENQYRTRIGYSPIDTYIFNTSIKNNLLLANPNADDKELIHVLEALKLFDPPRLDLNSPLDEFGKNFSGGELRKITIAQTIISNTELKIFDEPFAYLDPESVSEVEKIIFDLGLCETIIVVTHSFSNLNLFDRILRLHDGELSEIENFIDYSKKEIKNKQ